MPRADPTHRTTFGMYTFAYWVETSPLRRQVPHYEQPLPLDLDSVRFGFKSSRPFLVRHGFVKLLSSWVNISTWTKEFYEERLCWIMPAYEVEFVTLDGRTAAPDGTSRSRAMSSGSWNGQSLPVQCPRKSMFG